MRIDMIGAAGDAVTAPLPKDVNSVEYIFDKYREIGFLYTDKMRKLSPHFPEITDNWKKMLGAREQLMWNVVMTDESLKENFASVSVWQQSNYGLFAQHLVSTGNPFLSLKVLKEAQFIAQHHFNADQVRSSQNWFRPNNRYAFRIFASMYEKLGASKASLNRFQYLHIPLAADGGAKPTRFLLREVTGPDEQLIRLVSALYGKAFVRTEELDQEDINLQYNGSLYGRYGCLKYRKIWKCCDRATGRLLGTVIANRAPLGLNFSFLENRAYYIIDPELPIAVQESVLQSLNHAVFPVYRDFDLQVVPVVTNESVSKLLQLAGAEFQREYMQSTWLRDGFEEWYEHIDSFLRRIEHRASKVV